MADQATMNDPIVKAVAEATRATIQTMVELHQGQEDQRPKVGSLALKQPQFNWDMADKYTEWKAFILEVRNVISTYNICQQEKIVMVKNRLGRKGLHYLESLTEVEKQACGTLQGLIDTLAKKFRPQYNETIKSLQFRQLCRHYWENTEEWMERLRVVVAECNYKELDHQLKEQFTHGMVVGKDNHNHHGRSYVIQHTNNGRCILRNRCHIKPTTITADTYLQHQSKTLSNKTTDPLAEILKNINNNLALYAIA